MPLKLATIGQQRSLSSLAKSLFDLEASPELRERAQAALVKANPHLAERGGLVAGATVVVPDVAGLALKGGVRTTAPGASSLPDHGEERLKALATASERLIVMIEETAKADLDTLKQRNFIAAFESTHPELKADLAKITESVSAEAERAYMRSKQLLDAVKRAQADEERLQKRRRVG